MEKEMIAFFDDDTKRMHRFIIEDGQGIKGSIYVPKDEVVPDKISILLKTGAEKKRDHDET